MIKNILIVFSLIFILIALLYILLVYNHGKIQNTRNKIYLYNTPEYNFVVKNAKVSIEEAKTKVCKAYKNKILLNKNISFLQKDKIEFGYYFIHLNNYVFSNSILITKHDGSTTVTDRIYINLNTGELRQEHKNKMIYVKELKYLISIFNCIDYY